MKNGIWHVYCTQRKKATIHQLTTTLATSKNVLFPAGGYDLEIGHF